MTKEKENSVTDYLYAQYNEVPQNIRNSSSTATGNHREKILMDLIKKRFMPNANRAICKGHCLKNNEEKSKEIDILIWDTKFSSRFDYVDADYNQVTPESVRAAIEVKSSKDDFTEGFLHILKEGTYINEKIKEENLMKRSTIGEQDSYPPIFAGVFVYEGCAKSTNEQLQELFKSQEIKDFLLSGKWPYLPVIFCVIGKNILAKFHRFGVDFFELQNKSIEIFLEILRAWLEEDKFHNLDRIENIKGLLTRKPILSFILVNPIDEAYK